MTGSIESSRVLQTAQRAAEAGGREIAAAFRRQLESSTGGDTTVHRAKQARSYNLVTETDERSERLIVEAIRSTFPRHAILAEEAHSETPDAEHLWIIDPLDGTNNFAHGIPHCAVSIAYRQRGRTEVGVVHNPITGDWYVARRGRGATWNGRPVRVSHASSLDRVLIGVGFYYDRGEMMRATLAAIAGLFGENIHGIRRFGTASLDLCFVASGRFGAFFEYELAPWDFTAGALIVEEAGGQVSDVEGNPLRVAGGSVLAAAPGIYDCVRRIVESHRPAAE